MTDSLGYNMSEHEFAIHRGTRKGHMHLRTTSEDYFSSSVFLVSTDSVRYVFSVMCVVLVSAKQRLLSPRLLRQLWLRYGFIIGRGNNILTSIYNIHHISYATSCMSCIAEYIENPRKSDP